MSRGTESTPMTYLTPPHGVPTRATLSQSLDFRVPTGFADSVRQIFEFADGDPERCLDAFDATLGLFPRGRGRLQQNESCKACNRTDIYDEPME
jgi:hypothetical protein